MLTGLPGTLQQLLPELLNSYNLSLQSMIKNDIHSPFFSHLDLKLAMILVLRVSPSVSLKLFTTHTHLTHTTKHSVYTNNTFIYAPCSYWCRGLEDVWFVYVPVHWLSQESVLMIVVPPLLRHTRLPHQAGNSRDSE